MHLKHRIRKAVSTALPRRNFKLIEKIVSVVMDEFREEVRRKNAEATKWWNLYSGKTTIGIAPPPPPQSAIDRIVGRSMTGTLLSRAGVVGPITLTPNLSLRSSSTKPNPSAKPTKYKLQRVAK